MFLQRLGAIRARLRTNFALVRVMKLRSFATKAQMKTLPYETDTIVAEHTELYRYDNFRHFSVIKFFGITQLFAWSYLAEFSYRYLKDAKPPAPAIVEERSSFVRRITSILTENKYRNGITALCLVLGNRNITCLQLWGLRDPMSAEFKLCFVSGQFKRERPLGDGICAKICPRTQKCI